MSDLKEKTGMELKIGHLVTINELVQKEAANVNYMKSYPHVSEERVRYLADFEGYLNELSEILTAHVELAKEKSPEVFERFEEALVAE